MEDIHYLCNTLQGLKKHVSQLKKIHDRKRTYEQHRSHPGLDQKSRITSESEIEDEEFLFRFMGEKCFPRKDLTTITGPAKGGKTFFSSLLMACSTKDAEGTLLHMERISQEPLKVMWYDTEQSKHTTKKILVKRISRMIGMSPFPDELFFVFNVRCFTQKERLDYLPVAIDAYRPDIVIVDGIADLIHDINDGPASSDLMEKFLKMANTFNCNIVLVIHLNRSGEKSNLRGWLGSVMLQKSYEVFNCTKVLQTKILSVEMSTSRNTNIEEKLYYTVNNQGIPVVTEKPDIQQRDPNGKFACKDSTSETANNFNREYTIHLPDSEWTWDFRKLFSDALAGCSSKSYEEMETEIMKLANIKQKQYYYKVLAQAEELGVIKKTKDRCGRVVIVMPPQ